MSSKRRRTIEGGEETFAVRNANGTGAFIGSTAASPTARTVLDGQSGLLGHRPRSRWKSREIVFTPIQDQATRVAALLSGEVDFIQDVPVQDLARVDASTDALPGRHRAAEPGHLLRHECQGDDDLVNDSVEGRQPLRRPCACARR